MLVLMQVLVQDLSTNIINIIQIKIKRIKNDKK